MRTLALVRAFSLCDEYGMMARCHLHDTTEASPSRDHRSGRGHDKTNAGGGHRGHEDAGRQSEATAQHNARRAVACGGAGAGAGCWRWYLALVPAAGLWGIGCARGGGDGGICIYGARAHFSRMAIQSLARV